MTSKHEILDNFYKQVWERGNFDVIEDYFDLTTSKNRLINDAGIEPNEIREWVGIIRSYVTDIKVEIIKSIEEGEWISAYLQIDCIRLDNGAPVHVYQQIMLRFLDGRKIESYPQFDFLRFFEQIGQLPENTHELLLGGTKLH